MFMFMYVYLNAYTCNVYLRQGIYTFGSNPLMHFYEKACSFDHLVKFKLGADRSRLTQKHTFGLTHL